LGPRVGLGAPLLRAWLAGDATAPRQFLASLPLAAGLGVAASIAIVVLDVFVFGPNLGTALPAAQQQQPDVWLGLLAALYGGIDEEILLRLGLMTLLVWLGSKITRTRGRPGPGLMWTANILAALLFGLGHLPATASVLPLTGIVIFRAIVLNGLAGIVFGWLYWRHGILTAMASHFCADLVLHVLTPLLIAPK
jgi:membrane protease YdiL (CAAX protease family)